MKQIDKETITIFLAKLEQVSSPLVIIPHINADGDAIGSVLGFAGILKNAGRDVSVISPNHFPDYYKWMRGANDIVIYTTSKKRAEALINEAGMIICMDFNHLSRAGEMKSLVENFKGASMLIDHHPFPQGCTELTISRPDCSSTAELAFHVVKEMGYQQYMDKSIAECFFCGIMTDTGSFDYNVSDPQTFQTVSELLTYQIDPEEIHGNVFDNYSADRMRLLGYCLNECMEVYPEYHTAMLYLSKEVQQRFNFVSGDNEGFVNYPLSIKGIHFSVLFTEKNDHVKASFRSKGRFAVNEVASKHFNGGGHRNAAGGEINLSFQETLEKFRNLLPEYLEKLKES